MRSFLGRYNLVRASVFLVVSVLALTVVVQTANAALTLENVKTWYWTWDTQIRGVARGDIDGDSQVEIVTGGFYYDNTRYVAQLAVWSGATLALENIKTWYWTNNTWILAVVVADVDGDSQSEIITGGYYNDNIRNHAQLIVWNGATLTPEDIKTWYWTGTTMILSVAVGNVDADAQVEIVTGGYYHVGTSEVAQLCVWNGATLALENVKTWQWTGSTAINSVVIANVDGDGQNEIVTGGYYYDGIHYVAQLAVWSGATLALENIKTWKWTSSTVVESVSIGDVDEDGSAEIVTGGDYFDGTREVAQLCVWNGATLALENIKTWFWTDDTNIQSLVYGDVDNDAHPEIVTGGQYFDGTRRVAQAVVWSGSTLTPENLKTWYWTSHTYIRSVAIGNVDSDAGMEIVTGGYYLDGTHYNAQLCVWA